MSEGDKKMGVDRETQPENDIRERVPMYVTPSGSLHLRKPIDSGSNRSLDPVPRPWEVQTAQPMDVETLTVAMGLGKNTVIGGFLMVMARELRTTQPAAEPASHEPYPYDGTR